MKKILIASVPKGATELMLRYQDPEVPDKVYTFANVKEFTFPTPDAIDGKASRLDPFYGGNQTWQNGFGKCAEWFKSLLQ